MCNALSVYWGSWVLSKEPGPSRMGFQHCQRWALVS